MFEPLCLDMWMAQHFIFCVVIDYCGLYNTKQLLKHFTCNKNTNNNYHYNIQETCSSPFCRITRLLLYKHKTDSNVFFAQVTTTTVVAADDSKTFQSIIKKLHFCLK